MNALRTGGAIALLTSLTLAQVIGPPPVLVPSIQPNDGIVGGSDAAGYHLYLVPGLGTATPGAPVAFALSPTLTQNLQRFVIDQANANIIAATAPTVAGGPVEIWQIAVQGSTVLSETLLTTLSGTNGLIARSIHRDASGCILVLCRPPANSATFTVHRVAVTSSGGMASQIPITLTGDMMDAIATDPIGGIVLGGTLAPAPFGSANPGVTYTVSQAGGTPTLATTIAGFHVIAADTDANGVAALGLSPQTLPPTANYSCGGAGQNLQFNTSPFTTLYNDVERAPAGNEIVLAGSGFFALGAPGGVVKVTATGCTLGALVVPPILFPHGMNQAVIAVPSKNYGCACVPSNNILPRIAETTPPIVGQPWTITLRGGVPNSTAMLISGRGDQSFNGSPLPQSLSVLGGQPSGFLLNSAQFQFPLQATGVTGGALNTRTIPNNPALIGSKLFSEWLVFETTAGVPAFSSAGLASTVQ